ncbi:MAG: peptide-binding protein [Planctomycetota bacterium]|jgi:peptide/nickel transport system substrate-binding protein
MANNRRAATFLLLLVLAIIISLQIMAMVRSNRLSKRINEVVDAWADVGQISVVSDTTANEYPGDEGDWLIWAMHVEPKTLNPFSVDSDIYARWITARNIFESLLVYDWDQLRFVPWLAQKYEVSPNGLEITFHLRQDIYFSDGVPVTSEDVIFTYETIINPEVDAAAMANFYIDVDKVVKIDDRVVKFYMKKPYFKALEVVGFWDVGILPKHIYKFTDPGLFNKRVSNPIGSGPYLFEKWAVGNEVVLRRNDNYWGRKPKLKKFIYKFIPNNIASLQALRSHQVDMMIPDMEQFADLLTDEEFNKEFNCVSYWNPGAPFYYLGWNQNTPFFSDRRVRLAMTHIVNRQQVVSQLLKGQAETITGPFYLKGNQNDPDIKPWPYDLQKARTLLDEAGWIDTDGDGVRDKNGIPFRFKFMYSSHYILYQRIAKLLKDEAAKVGIEVIPDPYEWSVVIGRLTDRKFEAMIMGWGGELIEDFYQIFHSSQIENRGSNYVAFRNDQADTIMEKIRITMDEAERDRLSRQLHRILHDQQPYTFLYARPTFRLVDKRFANTVVHKLGFNYLEWYVPKELQKYN